MPDLNHLWQRFLLASSLLVGLAIGAAATVFGYSNLGSVNVRWSVFHIDGVPLWTVAVVPLALVLIAGTIYHWLDGFHHFTEHMRHRRRVHELEAEVASLRAHLDQVLEMPDHSTSKLSEKRASAASLPAADADEAMAGVVDHADVADVVSPKPEPAHTEQSAKTVTTSNASVTVAEGGNGEKASAARKDAHGRSRRRATLTVEGDKGEPDRSGSHVEGSAPGGAAAETAVTPAPEA